MPLRDEREAMTDRLLPCPFCGWDGIHVRKKTQMRECVLWLWSFAKTCGVDADDLREYGVEV